MWKDINILCNAPVYERTDDAEDAKAFVLSLNEFGIPLKIRPSKQHNSEVISRRIEDLTNTPLAAGFINVTHNLPPFFQRISDARFNIGRTMFGTDSIPEDWAAKCNEMDEIWVPSEFNLQAFVSAGVRPETLVKIPGHHDFTKYSLDIFPLPIDKGKGFSFLSVFDWTLRKGWDILLKAYIDEFRADEVVTLILKVWSSCGRSVTQLQQEVDRYIKDVLLKDPEKIPDILFLDLSLSQDEAPNLYKAVDAYVMPSRGEGWGRQYIEAMAMGLPTIGTRWGGNLEFMDDNNSFLIDCETVDVPEGGWKENIGYKGFKWAEPSVAHLRSLMRHVYECRDETRKKGKYAREEVLRKYNKNVVTGDVIRRLNRLANGRNVARKKSKTVFEKYRTGRNKMTVLYIAGTPMWAHVYGVRNGLRDLGVDVITIGTSIEGSPFYGSIMDALKRYDPNFTYDLICEPDESIEDILLRVKQKPDLILYMENGAAFLPKGLASVPIPTIGMLTEDFSHADWEPDFFPYFDTVISTLQESVDTYRPRGHDNLEYLCIGGVDRYHHDYNLPRIYDVCLLGGLTPLHRQRAKTVSRILSLKEEGVKFHIGYGAYFEEYGRLYSQSKIVLNRSACDQFNMRVFEAAACGALAITNRPKNPLDPSSHFLIEGQHVLYYDSDEEAIELIRYYLQHEEERQRIATAGRDYVLSHHTYTHVARNLFERIVSKIRTDFYERRQERLIQWGIDSLRQTLDYGKYFYLHNRPDIAEQFYQEAGHVKPGSLVSLGLGVTTALRGDLIRAKQFLKESEKEAQSISELVLAQVNMAGVLFHHRDRLPAAEIIEACMTALETLKEGDIPPQTLRNWLYFPLLYDRFRMELSEAFWKIPVLSDRWQRLRQLLCYEIYRFLGLIALDLEKFDEAIISLSRAVEILPDDGFSLYDLGRAYFSKGDRNAAEKWLRRALEEAPFYSEAQQLLNSLFSKGVNSNAVNQTADMQKDRFKPGISAIVHTLNEEKKIEDALKSLQGWVDEIIVCDMYSDDRTVEIARRYTDRIIFHPREKYADPARNFAVSHARHEWVFILDADERVSPELGAYLRQQVDRGITNFDALAIPMDDRWIGRRLRVWEARWPMYKSPQFIRNGRFRFTGRVHEGPVIDGKTACLNSEDKRFSLTHFAWDGLHHWMQKINNYTDAEVEKLDAAGERFHWQAAIRAFIEAFHTVANPSGLQNALEFIVAFSGANYHFYKYSKLHERHLITETLTSKEDDAPKDIIEVLEYALEVARKLNIREDTKTSGNNKPVVSKARQRFSLYHTEGKEDSLKRWLAPYADMFKGCQNVLDVGCGPGFFLELLRERGISCIGIDNDPDMVSICRSKGLRAEVADAGAFSHFSKEVDHIHMGHVIEHMDGSTAVEMLEARASILPPGGLLLIRTPNWQNETVRTIGFWLDHTHVRPYPLELLERVYQDIGFEIVQKGYEPSGWNDTYILGRKLEHATPVKVQGSP